jgi:putative transposase
MGHGLLRLSLKPSISIVAHLLAYVTGLVNQELLQKNEYFLAENCILKAHLQPGFKLSRPERTTLAEIGKRLGRKLLQQVARIAMPDTILGWYRQLVAAKFDGSLRRRTPGRPPVSAEIENLVGRLARENSGWATIGSLGALANMGHSVSDQTVGNILRRYGIKPAPKRKRTTTWNEFIRSHMAVLVGTDFFTVEVLTHRMLQNVKVCARLTTPKFM